VERRVVRAEAAEDLVGRDVDEAKARRALGRQARPIAADRFEQAIAADDIGVDERGRVEDRAVDVRLGREMDDRLGLVEVEQARDQLMVTDVAVDEGVRGVVGDGGEIAEIAGVGQRVEIDDARAARDLGEHEVRADEAGAAGDEPGGRGHGVPLARRAFSASTTR
jgi:hypothetical protein